jgi:hypothetical protein
MLAVAVVAHNQHLLVLEERVAVVMVVQMLQPALVVVGVVVMEQTQVVLPLVKAVQEL